MLRVSTAEGVEEFRPHRLAWKAPDKFSISGLAGGRRIARVSLRFETPNLASEAASSLKEMAQIVEEPLLPVEEVQVHARILLTAKGLVILAYGFVLRLIFVGALSLILFSALGLVALVPVGFLVLYLTLPLWPVVAEGKLTIAFLRFDGKSIVLHSRTSWITITPKSIGLKDAKTLVLTGRSVKAEVSLATNDEVIGVVQRIESTFPAVHLSLVLEGTPII